MAVMEIILKNNGGIEVERVFVGDVELFGVTGVRTLTGDFDAGKFINSHYANNKETAADEMDIGNLLSEIGVYNELV